MKIFTLNVNGFRGAEMQPFDSVSKEELRSNFLHFLNLLKEKIIQDDETVLIVQEFPHRTGNRSNGYFRWLENPFHKDCLDNLGKSFNVVLPTHLINSEQCTIALCSKHSKWHRADEQKFQYNPKFDYGNTIVELQYEDEDMSLLGVHVKPTELMWKLIFETHKNHGKYSFVVGDFNAYEHRGTMCDKPKMMRELGYLQLVSSNTITNTKYQSSIDNIYMNNELVDKYEPCVSIQRLNDFQTDHTLCGVNLKMR